MIFTGKNLLLVRYGIDLALDELHNQVATCPDVDEYADMLDEIAVEQEQFKRLLARVDRAIAKENLE